jgi:hypothetical protein
MRDKYARVMMNNNVYSTLDGEYNIQYVDCVSVVGYAERDMGKWLGEILGGFLKTGLLIRPCNYY